MIILVQDACVDHLRDALMGKVRIDRAGTKAHQAGDLVHVSGLSALQNQRDGGSLLRAYQMLLHAGDCKERRDRDMVLVHASVRQDQDVVSLSRRPVHRDIELFQGMGQRCVLVVQQGNDPGAEALPVQGPDLDQIHPGQDRVVDLQDPAVVRLLFQKIAVRSDIHGGIHDHLLAQGVDGRIRHLGKQLLEITVQQLVMLRQEGERGIMAHGDRALDPIFSHRKDLLLHILVGVSEHLVQAVPHLLAVDPDLPVRDRHLGQMEEITVQPLPVGMGSGIHLLALIIGNDPLLFRIHQQDPARLQPGAHLDMRRIDVQHAHLRRQDQPAGIRHVIARRTQPVAVQCRSQDLAV